MRDTAVAGAGQWRRRRSAAAAVTAALRAVVAVALAWACGGAVGGADAAFTFGSAAVYNSPLGTRAGYALINVNGSTVTNIPDGTYLAGGYSGTTPNVFKNDFWYSDDGGVSSWVQLTSMPANRVLPAMYFAYNKIWIISGVSQGGSPGTNVMDTYIRIYSYNGLTWTTVGVNQMGGYAGVFAPGFAVIRTPNPDIMIFFGGHTNDGYAVATRAYYSTDAVNWNYQDLGGSYGRGYSTCGEFGAYVLCAGGIIASFQYVQTVSSTSNGNAWNHITAPWPGRAIAGMAAYNSKMFLAGGMYGSGTSQTYNDVWSATNPTSAASWVQVTASAPWGIRTCVLAVPALTAFYVMPGMSSVTTSPGYTYVQDVWRYQSDECLSLPCANGGTCLQGLASYRCVCATGFSGVRCQTNINECASLPCRNGGTCVDAVNGFTCTCTSAYTGALCQSLVSPCASAPCNAANSLSCTDVAGPAYQCACKAGYSGLRCQTDVNECASLPCANGGTCSDAINGFTCACVAAYSGVRCQTNVNECASTPCANGGTCSDGIGSYTCACVSGFSGAKCQTNVNECASLPCRNGATCVDGVNSFSCSCAAGYSGLLCQTNVNECASLPCRNGGTCTDGVNGFTCACTGTWGGALCQSDLATCLSQPCQNGADCVDVSITEWRCDCVAGYSGLRCQTNVNECASLPCANGGTCVDAVNGFTCTCVNGYSGQLCQTNINECASTPCANGGTCTDGIGSFTCACVTGFYGVRCETDTNECASNPCRNGGTCVDVVNGYTCGCATGYSGLRCETDINECASNPCRNGATCFDALNSFTCTCVSGFSGVLCETDINECASLPCANGGTCADGPNGFACACVTGYTGVRCQTNINECESQPCRNGADCIDAVNGFTCSCPDGYSGVTCQTDINECQSQPCANGGTCRDDVAAYYCTCAPGFTGVTCATDLNECASNPCRNGGTCADGPNRFTCACVTGWSGVLCQTNINECASQPCRNGGSCTDGLASYTCTCAGGFTGVECATDLDECASSPCVNGGTCVDRPNGFTCTCSGTWGGSVCQSNVESCASFPCVHGDCVDHPGVGWTCACYGGFEGLICQTNLDECASNPCAHGTCVDAANAFVCVCAPGFSGVKCETDVNECQSLPCANGGTCTDGIDSFTCQCVAGFEGLNCEVNVDECASAPCQNGAPCTDGINGYACECVTGFSGANCETNIDECASAPCANAGTCTDYTASYWCDCADGWDGDNCQIELNECASQPCANGGTCTDRVAGFTCACVTGFTGAACETDINECASQPCRNGGLCVDGVNGFTCTCADGYAGVRCATDVNECASNPCMRGAACTDLSAAFSCACPAGYSGNRCQTDVNECASEPCKNGAGCVDGINSYRCTCVAGYSGVRCETDINECASNPCRNGGTCVDAVNAFSCTCVNGYGGVRCQTDANECASQPCRNGGTCVDAVNGFACQCVAGTYGSQCEVNADECASAPCQNGGLCVDGLNSFRCTCAAGYSGVTCAVNIDECSPSPCANGGTCADGIASFTCTCVAGYNGANCAAGHGLCLAGACLNGGKCVAGGTTASGADGFSCTCVTGYSGQFCQIPPAPTARVSAPADVGSCDTLTLDATTSISPTGSALSFAWHSVDTTSGTAVWTPLPVRPYDAAAAAGGASVDPMDGQFGTYATADGRKVVFAAVELNASPLPHAYTFGLIVSAADTGRSGNTSFVVTKQSAALPAVVVTFPAALRRTSDASLMPAVSAASCAAAGTTYGFAWLITPPIAGVNTNVRNLYVAPQLVAVGTAYTFALTVTVTSPAVPTPVTATVTVVSAPIPAVASALVVLVSGGNRAVAVSSTLLIDGSLSRDPDNTIAQSALHYEWECQYAVDGAACSDVLSRGSAVNWLVPTLVVPVGSLTVGRQYAFRLVLEKATAREAASVWVFVDCTADPAWPNPTVTITGPGAVVLNPGAKLALNGLVYSASGSTAFTYRWSDVTGQLNLTDPNTIAVVPNSPNMVVRSTALSAGNVYVLRLTCDDSNKPVTTPATTGGTGYAQVTVTVNVPPSGGVCDAVRVPTGSAPGGSDTKWALSCWGWTAPNTPLLYAWAVVNADATETPLCAPQPAAQLQVDLPFGDTTVRPYVFDALSAKTVAPVLRVNTPLPPAAVSDPAGYTANLTTALQNAINAQDPNAGLALVGVLTGIVNGGNTGSSDNTALVGGIIDALNSLSHNLTDSSTVNTIISLLSQATANPNAVDGNGYDTTLDILKNLLNTQQQIQNQNVANANTGGTVGDSSANGNVVVQATQTASNFLNSNNCSSMLADVQALMRQILALQQTGTVAGESATAIDTAQINAIVQRAYQSAVSTSGSSGDSSSGTGGVSTALPSFSTGNSSYDISVVTYSNVSRCLAGRSGGNSGSTGSDDLTVGECLAAAHGDTSTSNPVFASDLVTAEVTYANGTVHDVSGLTTAQAVNFSIPVTPGTGDRVRCTWWNEGTRTWDTSGCATYYDAAKPDVVMCSCTHLTDFAVLLNNEKTRNEDQCVALARLTDSITYRIFLAFYAVLGAVAWYRAYRTVAEHGWKQKQLAVGCHALVMLVCVCRLGVMLTYIFAAETSFAVVAMLASAPYVFVYWLHTFLIFAWAGIYHYATSSVGENPFLKLKRHFIAINLAVVCGALTLFALVAFDTTDTADTSHTQLLSDIGSYVIGALSLVTGVAFMVYGGLLTRNLTQDFASRHARKIFIVACVCSGAFVVESGVVLYSALQPDDFYAQFAAYNSVYLAADLLCLSAVLYLFRSDSERIERNSKYEGSSMGSHTGVVSPNDSMVMSMATSNGNGLGSGRSRAIAKLDRLNSIQMMKKKTNGVGVGVGVSAGTHPNMPLLRAGSTVGGWSANSGSAIAAAAAAAAGSAASRAAATKDDGPRSGNKLTPEVSEVGSVDPNRLSVMDAVHLAREKKQMQKRARSQHQPGNGQSRRTRTDSDDDEDPVSVGSATATAAAATRKGDSTRTTAPSTANAEAAAAAAAAGASMWGRGKRAGPQYLADDGSTGGGAGVGAAAGASPIGGLNLNDDETFGDADAAMADDTPPPSGGRTGPSGSPRNDKGYGTDRTDRTVSDDGSESSTIGAGEHYRRERERERERERSGVSGSTPATALVSPVGSQLPFDFISRSNTTAMANARAANSTLTGSSGGYSGGVSGSAGTNPLTAALRKDSPPSPLPLASPANGAGGVQRTMTVHSPPPLSAAGAAIGASTRHLLSPAHSRTPSSPASPSGIGAPAVSPSSVTALLKHLSSPTSSNASAHSAPISAAAAAAAGHSAAPLSAPPAQLSSGGVAGALSRQQSRAQLSRQQSSAALNGRRANTTATAAAAALMGAAKAEVSPQRPLLPPRLETGDAAQLPAPALSPSTLISIPPSPSGAAAAPNASLTLNSAVPIRTTGAAAGAGAGGGTAAPSPAAAAAAATAALKRRVAASAAAASAGPAAAPVGAANPLSPTGAAAAPAPLGRQRSRLQK